MNYITPEQVLFIHYRIIEETGGSHGIRDLALLQSALARPMATFDENDLYPDIFSKAAALMHSIIKSHPFMDGNKRTAYSSCGVFLASSINCCAHFGQARIVKCWKNSMRKMFGKKLRRKNFHFLWQFPPCM